MQHETDIEPLNLGGGSPDYSGLAVIEGGAVTR